MIIDIVLVFAQGRGGLEDVLANVSENLTNRGHTVRIFQAYEPNYKEWINKLPNIYYYGLGNSLEEENLESLSMGYRKKLECVGVPDIILATHAPSVSYICSKAIEFLNDDRPNVISWLHGDVHYFGGENLLNFADAHLAISTQIAKEISENIINKKDVYYIGNPVQIENLKILDIERDCIDLIYIGRISNRDKRLDVILKALALVNFPWSLTIIGSGESELELKELAYNLGISHMIKWKGWIERPWDCVEKATALIISSDSEAFGLVMIEALSRGIPVISSNTYGAMDIIENEKNGWLFKKGDYEELAELINKVNEKIKNVSQKYCIESVKKFDENIVVDKMECILKRYDKNGEYYKNVINVKNTIKDLINSNNLDLAEELLTKYEEIITDDVEIYSIKGIIYILKGKFEDAYCLFNDALKIYNNNIDILFNMAYVCKVLDKNIEALKYYYDILIYSDNTDLNNEVKNEINLIYESIDKLGKKLTIDIVLHYLSGRGGTENVINIVSSELEKRGHKIRVFTGHKPEYNEWENNVSTIYFYSLNSDYKNDTAEGLIGGYVNKIRELGPPDIILATHLPIISYVCKQALANLGIDNVPVLSWLHIHPGDNTNIDLINFADNHISISNSISKTIRRFIDFDRTIYLVGNPVNDNNLNIIKRSNEKLELIYIGRLENNQKRIDTLLKAVSLLEGDWCLKIVGGGIHEDELKELARNLKVNEKIEWLGWKEEPWSCLNSATALILPSQMEGFALVSIEALQRGIPIITSRCPGSIDIVEDYKNGYSFEVGDYKRLYEILNSIRNGELKLPTEEACKESVKDYEVNKVINKIETILINEYMNKNN